MSPKLDARVDNPKYRQALRQCLNMIPLVQGPITRRPGTQFIAQAKFQNIPGFDPAVRLLKFIFSPTTTFVLELGQEYIRFYSNGQRVSVNSAPLWASGQNYVVGNFVTSTVNALIYYCIQDVSSSTDPSLDAVNWVQQSIYEVPSPYQANAFGLPSVWATDVWRLVSCQINDVVYLVHPDYPPYKLTRFGDTDWVLQEVVFDTPALLDQNATDTAIQASATTGPVNLTATAPTWTTATYYAVGNSVLQGGSIYNCTAAHVSGVFANDLAAGDWTAVTIFNPGVVGSTWQLAFLRNSSYLELDGTAAGGFGTGTDSTGGSWSALPYTSGSLACLGGWEVHTYGVWTADIAVQRSLDGGQTWDTVVVVSGRSDRNVDISGTAAVTAMYRFMLSVPPGVSPTPINPGATNPRVVFECVDSFLYGTVKITGVSGPYAASATVIDQLYSTPQPDWIQGTSYNVGNVVQYQGLLYTCLQANIGFIVNANTLTVGSLYIIDTAGSTDYTLAGAANNNVGTAFVATNTGNGSGTVWLPPPTDTTNWVQSGSAISTTYWSEAAWSDYRGYPQAITSFQQRVIYGGSGFEPQRIWGTVTNDIENFALGDQTKATDSFAFDLNAPSRGPIVWLLGQLNLFVGFSGAEWIVNSGSSTTTGAATGAAISPSNIQAVEQSSWGSAVGVAPMIVGDALVFCQRQASTTRQMLFNIYQAKYSSQDVTVLADHLFTPGIVQMDYQQRFRGQSMIWVVTQQGLLCSLSYDVDQQVYAWARHRTGDANTSVGLIPDRGFESVAVIDGAGQNDDEVWVVSDRFVGSASQGRRYIERINPQNWEVEFLGAPNPPAPVLADAFYVDSGTTILNPGSATLTGLDHLDGRNVVGLADGVAFGPLPVVTGSVTIPAPATVGKVQIGLPVNYTGQPMRIDLDPARGVTQGLQKAVADRMFLRVLNSCGGQVWNGNAGSFPVPLPFIPASNPILTPQLVIGPKDLPLQGMLTPTVDDNAANDPTIIVQGSDAYPLTVLALLVRYTIDGTP